MIYHLALLRFLLLYPSLKWEKSRRIALRREEARSHSWSAVTGSAQTSFFWEEERRAAITFLVIVKSSKGLWSPARKQMGGERKRERERERGGGKGWVGEAGTEFLWCSDSFGCLIIRAVWVSLDEKLHISVVRLGYNYSAETRGRGSSHCAYQRVWLVPLSDKDMSHTSLPAVLQKPFLLENTLTHTHTHTHTHTLTHTHAPPVVLLRGHLCCKVWHAPALFLEQTHRVQCIK